MVASDLLERADAPAELLVWLAAHRDDPWRDCSRGDWLIWIGAALGAPIALLLDATSRCVGTAIDALPSGRAPLRRAVAAAREVWLTEGSAAVGQRCIEAARALAPSADDGAGRREILAGFADGIRRRCYEPAAGRWSTVRSHHDEEEP